MKIRRMYDDGSKFVDCQEKIIDTHSETIQNGYYYRVKDLISNYTDEELRNLERDSKLAFESVERTVFFDDLNPKEVEQYKKLKKEKDEAKRTAEQREIMLKEFEREYIERMKKPADPPPVE